ncbi:MAG: hypothetical protein MK085_06540 [Phycisphaerales bacterium]|nr:hypothetical protein [Phycisphaerales bacterium]
MDQWPPKIPIPGRLAVVASLLLGSPALSEHEPFAVEVVSYAPGSGGVPGFDDPSSALGPPTRTSGGALFPAVTTPFQPAFMPEELVSIGAGGALVLAFDHLVENDPANPFGIDLIVFGNAFHGDLAPPMGIAGTLYSEGGAIEVSLDGTTWHLVPGVMADGALPTLGWIDRGPYDTTPGRIPSDFTRPVNPDHQQSGLQGMEYPTILDAYDRSGGGAGIDLDVVGLQAIRFVRISNSSAMTSPEIDAVADVAPTPPSEDLNGDGSVDGVDLGLMLAAWGTDDAVADLDGSGLVDGGDLGLLFAAWSAK